MWDAVGEAPRMRPEAGAVLQHPSIASLKRELSGNPALLQACGFEVLPLPKKPVAQLIRDELTGRMKVVWPIPEPPRYAVSSSWHFSRFLRNLLQGRPRTAWSAG